MGVRESKRLLISDYLFLGGWRRSKTSSASREHHIHGLNQLIIPEGFDKGWLTSMLIRETDGSSGITCLGLLEKIINLFSGSEDEIIQQITTLEFKIENRGIACRDSRYFFMLTNDSLRKIKMRSANSNRVQRNKGDRMAGRCFKY